MQPGEPSRQRAIAVKGWFGAHRYLLLRRLSQLAILALFLAGPGSGIWIVKGNIASSLTLDTCRCQTRLVLLQMLLPATSRSLPR